MKPYLLHFIIATFLLNMPYVAVAEESNTASQSPDESAGWFKKSVDFAVNKTENLYINGRLSMILSGYGYHGRSTYSQEKLSKFNEKVWGLGMSKELRDEKDNEESIQLTIMADSHYSPQILAAYSYQWMQPIGSQWEVGIGYLIGLGSRSDIFHGIPFPGALPLASIGTRDTKLVMSYIPRLKGKENGDVLYFGLRINLK